MASGAPSAASQAPSASKPPPSALHACAPELGARAPRLATVATVVRPHTGGGVRRLPVRCAVQYTDHSTAVECVGRAPHRRDRRGRDAILEKDVFRYSCTPEYVNARDTTRAPRGPGEGAPRVVSLEGFDAQFGVTLEPFARFYKTRAPLSRRLPTLADVANHGLQNPRFKIQ